MRELRVAVVGPIATSTPPPKSGSIETLTHLLTEGLVARGHEVTLFATGDSTTSGELHALFERGHWHDLSLWPWEFSEMLNLAAAVERHADFDLIHYQAGYYPMPLAFLRLCPIPILQTIHHAPSPEEIRIWSRWPEAPYVAISNEQARRMAGLNVVDVVLNGIDTDAFTFRAQPDDYLVWLGRFTEGKGILQAIEVARRVRMKLILAAAREDYYDEEIAPHVDGERVVYFGEADFAQKVELYGGARALLYPVQAPEPFGLVLAEAMACGTPVAALDKGAVREMVDEGVTGRAFETVDDMVAGLGSVLTLDRRRVREKAVARFGVAHMVDGYVAAYRKVLAAADAPARPAIVRSARG
jgi:glycosyltransferase involved in cell wall biosynthesis